MARRAIWLLCFASTARLTTASRGSSSQQEQLEVAWSEDLESDSNLAKKKSPIQRVITLLNKMNAELTAEAKTESEMYDKMVCWCETNGKEKTKAVADADAQDLTLTNDIAAHSARFGELSTEIARLKKQIDADGDSLKEAASIRKSETEQFYTEEKDLRQAIINLKNAVSVLGRNQGAAFVQLAAPLRAGISSLLRGVKLQYDEMIAARGSAVQTAFVSLKTNKGNPEDPLQAFLQGLGGADHGALPMDFAAKVVASAASATEESSHSFLQMRMSLPEVESRSDGIFGILNTMLQDFQSELSTIQKEQTSSQSDFEEMNKAKTEQLGKAREKLDDLQSENSRTQKALSDAKEDIEIVREQRSADVLFLRNLKQTCEDLDNQWTERRNMRAEEMKAVSETVSILTDDDNKEQMRKTINFLQVWEVADTGAVMRARRAHSVEILRRAAENPDFDGDDLLNAWHSHTNSLLAAARAGIPMTGNPREKLATLAVSVQMDGFGKVKKNMDHMIDVEKEQQDEEVHFMKNCKDMLNDNEKELHHKGNEKKDLEGKIEHLAALMEKLENDIAVAREQSENMAQEIKKASQAREEENAEFQTTVADQRATQEILRKALAKLEEFYKKPAFLQRQSVGQTPPVKFAKYKKSSGASPVISMIEQIVEESKTLEKEAMTGEASAQKDYETVLANSNSIIDKLSNAIKTKLKAGADAKLESAQAAKSLEAVSTEIESLTHYREDLHTRCDFVMDNFDIRQKARMDEIESIKTAEAALSGATHEAPAE